MMAARIRTTPMVILHSFRVRINVTLTCPRLADSPPSPYKLYLRRSFVGLALIAQDLLDPREHVGRLLQDLLRELLERRAAGRIDVHPLFFCFRQ